MRKLSFVLAFVAATIAGNAQDAGRSNAIKLNPLSLFVLTGNMAYEHAINSNQSAQLGVFYSSFSLSGLSYTGWGVTPEYRIYFGGAKEALNGVYAGPFVRYQSYNLKEKETTNKTTLTTIGGGALIGWQKMWNSGFTLDLFAGPAYNNAKFKNENDDATFNVKGGITGFGIRSGLTIGFGF